MWKSHEKPIVIDLFQTGNHGFSTSTSVLKRKKFIPVPPRDQGLEVPAVNGDLSNEVETMGIYRIYQQCWFIMIYPLRIGDL